MGTGSVMSLYRFPVKSMWGEELDELTITAEGVVGNRRFAVVDRGDGNVASAKHPRKWGKLLELRAAYTDDPQGAPDPGKIRVEFPDGTSFAGDSPLLETALGRFTGRDVTLTSGPLEKNTSEALWPDIAGLAPKEIIDMISGGRTEGDDALSEIPIGSASGGFVDVAPVHILTTSTLRKLASLAPESTFTARRYRPNILVDVPGEEFVENDWRGTAMTLGEAAELEVTMPTVRCVMTTLAQGELPEDRNTLRTLARANRLNVPELGGVWACAGVYANVTHDGVIRRGDTVRVTRGGSEPGTAV
jgi:uncharacterized protein YcbX